MTDSSQIIGAFNEPPSGEEPLHEVSGITEGTAMINGSSVDVTVAIADKNNAGGDDKRTGIDQVGISYVDGDNNTIYKTLDVVDSNGSPLDSFGPEDIDYSSEYGVYVIVDEGGMKDGKGHLPTVYTAELKENGNGELQMVIQTETAMTVKHADFADGVFVDSDKNIGYTQYTPDGGGKGNGVEGLAIDPNGSIYMGEQDSGIIYKVEPVVNDDGKITGFNCDSAKAILDTGSNDLAGLDFNAEGDLIASFGNEASCYEENSVVKFPKTSDPSNPYDRDSKDILFTGSDETFTSKSKFDAEAVMVDSDGDVVMGSDNGFGTDGNERYRSEDSTVLVDLPKQDTSV